MGLDAPRALHEVGTQLFVVVGSCVGVSTDVRVEKNLRESRKELEARI